MSIRAKLRTCARCEWIYRGKRDCPVCGMISYGARYVYGNDAYKFEKTQEPWYNKKVGEFKCKLNKELEENIAKDKKENPWAHKKEAIPLITKTNYWDY